MTDGDYTCCGEYWAKHRSVKKYAVHLTNLTVRANFNFKNTLQKTQNFLSGKLSPEMALKLLCLESPTAKTPCVWLSPEHTLQNHCNRAPLVSNLWLSESYIIYSIPSILSPQGPNLIQLENVLRTGLGTKVTIHILQYCRHCI